MPPRESGRSASDDPRVTAKPSALVGESMFVGGSGAQTTASPTPPPQPAVMPAQSSPAWTPPTEAKRRLPRIAVIAVAVVIVAAAAGFGGWWYVGYQARLAATPVPSPTVAAFDMSAAGKRIDDKLHAADTALGAADEGMADTQGDLSE